MKIEDFFNKPNVVDLSFFNFRNAITAAYFADNDLRILKVNENFARFFPILGNVTQAYFPDVLVHLGIGSDQIERFQQDLDEKGHVLLPEVRVRLDGEERVYSLLSTKTKDSTFSYLNGVQGQFVDRTAEWTLRREKEALLDRQIRDQKIIEEKSQKLESLANRLARYLSPQLYRTLFDDPGDGDMTHKRKNLTVFFSDVVQFTDLSDTLEPERFAAVINSYLSEMASIAIEAGGTIDKFVGDAILVFFGDPETEGDSEDALRCLDMALGMQARIAELQSYWKKLGVSGGLHVRMGIATGFCTVGNFGSNQRLDYTVFGRPVNLAARLQAKAAPDSILIDQSTKELVESHIDCEPFRSLQPKGFSRPREVYKALDFKSEAKRSQRRRWNRRRDHVEVTITDSSDIAKALLELRDIEREFEEQLAAQDGDGREGLEK
jgi:class 3 adenylate cyclase